MKKIFGALVTVCFLFIVVGCGKSNKLVGKWEGATEDGLKTTFVFNKDNTVSYENEYGFDSIGKYEIKDNKVTISLESWSDDKVYEFKVDGKTLDLVSTDKYSPTYKGMKKAK